MAVQQRMRVPFEDVFPAGAYMVGEVEPVEDFDLIRAARESGRDPGDVQTRDKVTGKRVWQVRVVDADPEARKGQTELVVKVSADVQPVPPAALDGLPFRPVVFERLTVTAYVDESRGRPRIAWSLRAEGLSAPGKTNPGSAQSAQSGSPGKAA
jgi:hypothetical protein